MQQTQQVLEQKTKQVLEQKNISPRSKPSEVFYEAVRNGIRQIKHEWKDDKGGYCAMGLLRYYAGFDLDNRLEDIRKIYDDTYGNTIATHNDYKGLTFKEFGDRFAAIGL